MSLSWFIKFDKLIIDPTHTHSHTPSFVVEKKNNDKQKIDSS